MGLATSSVSRLCRETPSPEGKALLLIRAFAVDYGAEGFGQVHDVEPDGPVMDVPGVHGYALGEGGVAAAAGLPHAGDAGLREGYGLEVAAYLVFLSREIWSRSYEAHVADEDVQDLWQFVEAAFPDEAAYSGDSGIVAFELLVGVPFGFLVRVLGEVFFQYLVAVLVHAAEFVAFECLAVQADAIGVEEGRATAVDLDCYGYA